MNYGTSVAAHLNLYLLHAMKINYTVAIFHGVHTYLAQLEVVTRRVTESTSIRKRFRFGSHCWCRSHCHTQARSTSLTGFIS